MDTLILNADGSPLSLLPLSTVTWQDSVRYMWLDRVTVLDWYDDWIVSSPSWETRVPAVLMIKDYIRTNRAPKCNKYNVTLRDEYSCQYCGSELIRTDVTMDHVIPVSKGGKTAWDNIVASCMPCNSAKGNKLIKPRKVPYEPTYYELVNKRKKFHTEIPHESWRTYI